MVDESRRGDIGLTVGYYRPLIRVRGTVSVGIKVLGPVQTWLMHWIQGDARTQPCLLRDCEHCSNFVSRRPLAYLAVQHYLADSTGVRWGERILEVPLSTGFKLSERRGETLAMRRLRKNGPIEIGSFVAKSRPPTIPVFDIVPALLRLWRLPLNSPLRLLDASEWSMWSVSGG